MFGNAANCTAHDRIGVSDLAIVELERASNESEFPELPRIYTGADFLDRLVSAFPVVFAPGPFFQQPWLVTATGATLGTVQQATYTAQPLIVPVSFQSIVNSFNGFTISVPHGSQPITDHGDSGGPLTFQGVSVPVIYAVNSGPREAYDDDTMSPTWNNPDHNGDFINSFFVDADEDGVDDRFDVTPRLATS